MHCGTVNGPMHGYRKLILLDQLLQSDLWFSDPVTLRRLRDVTEPTILLDMSKHSAPGARPTPMVQEATPMPLRSTGRRDSVGQ